MSLEVLGGLCALTPSYLSMIENGKRSLNRYSRIVTVAAALRVPPAELAPGMPDGQTPTPNRPVSPAPVPERQTPGRVVQALDVLDGEDTNTVADSFTQLIDHYSHAICAALRQWSTTSCSKYGPSPTPSLHTAAGNCDAGILS